MVSAWPFNKNNFYETVELPEGCSRRQTEPSPLPQLPAQPILANFRKQATVITAYLVGNKTVVCSEQTQQT